MRNGHTCIKPESVPVLDEYGEFAYHADAAEVHRLTFGGFGMVVGNKKRVHAVRLTVKLAEVDNPWRVKGRPKVVSDCSKTCVLRTVGDTHRVYSHVAYRCSSFADHRPSIDGDCL